MVKGHLWNTLDLTRRLTGGQATRGPADRFGPAARTQHDRDSVLIQLWTISCGWLVLQTCSSLIQFEDGLEEEAQLAPN